MIKEGAGNIMIKGCQKKIIHITDTGNPYFEEAYFILRQGGDFLEDEELNEVDIIRQAVKIAENGGASLKPRHEKRRRRRNRAFFCGLSLCSFLFGLVMLIGSMAH